ncbi:protein FAR1-RELATED SEQUENCE 6 isoform X2 [Canna indica]|uniref:Protein FAR1-RELATED SEQUENCE n=1 Tax=Canna indica TaxID=4628 RepID=A0AAQ3K7H8_9LILI|nr:protein FAR1-RELATED SEQUENCE 6 isoform X2 [Canna indica]
MLGCCPNAIVTDYSKAIPAFQVLDIAGCVSRCSTSLVLVQYLKKSSRELLKGLSEFEVIKKELKKAAYDSLKVDFGKCWKKMVVEHGLENNEWLTSLYENRHLWVPAFLKHTFWAGMSISQRGCCPNAIVINYSKAIQGAVLDVFPGFAQGSTMQTMGSELCICDSALIKAEDEEKGNGGDPGLRKRKIDTEVEEENEDVDEEEEEDDDDNDDDDNKEGFIRENEESDYEYIGEGSDSEFENEDDKEAYRKYREDFLSSGGFDIENYYLPPPRKMIFGMLFRVNHPGDGFGEHCEEAVKNVLKFQNQKNNTSLQYVKIIKANGGGGGLYYVTFEAEDTISRKGKTGMSWCSDLDDQKTLI